MVENLMTNQYSQDDLVCFENINSEQAILADYLRDCNSRKYSLFKLALTVFSVLTTASVALFVLSTEEDGLNIVFPFNYAFGLILISIGLINFVVIKELLSIHASRLITLRQMNCLRQAMDAIRYRKFMDKYPGSIDDLTNRETPYWLVFGQHRKLPLVNSGLRKSEQGVLRSPDKFMVLILTILSLCVMLAPMVYLGVSSDATFADGWLSGTVSIVFILGVVMQFSDSKKRLKSQIGVQTSDHETGGTTA
jgi:hypothetical protein